MAENTGESESDRSATDADWLFSQNLALYAGQWVAVLGQTILAHGSDLKRVHAEAMRRAAPARPLFYSVPTASFGGA
jgi:Family of unknown function (DUF5678)